MNMVKAWACGVVFYLMILFFSSSWLAAKWKNSNFRTNVSCSFLVVDDKNRNIGKGEKNILVMFMSLFLKKCWFVAHISAYFKIFWEFLMSWTCIIFFNEICLTILCPMVQLVGILPLPAFDYLMDQDYFGRGGGMLGGMLPTLSVV